MRLVKSYIETVDYELIFQFIDFEHLIIFDSEIKKIMKSYHFILNFMLILNFCQKISFYIDGVKVY